MLFVQEKSFDVNQGCSLLALIILGKEKGYDYIYGTGEAVSILYAKDQYDITKDIIKLLNDKYAVEGKKEEKGLLDGVPKVLPALSQAQEYQDRAARVGFDWAGIEGVLDKVKEEVEEIKNAESDFELASEIGDLFFALVNVARWKHVDAESALRGTNMKFKRRFAYVEQGAKRQERKLSDLTLEEMDRLWNEAKTKES